VLVLIFFKKIYYFNIFSDRKYFKNYYLPHSKHYLLSNNLTNFKICIIARTNASNGEKKTKEKTHSSNADNKTTTLLI